MARIQIIFEGHFILIFKYLNIHAHHCCCAQTQSGPKWIQTQNGRSQNPKNLAYRLQAGVYSLNTDCPILPSLGHLNNIV